MSSFAAMRLHHRHPSSSLFEFAFRKNRRGWILGILNATPDSFYAPSRGQGADWALTEAGRMLQDGVNALDIGAESTRPGAPAISAEDEQRRILPIVEALHRRYPGLPLSIDTQKASVARVCLAAGAGMINDISALRADPAMAETLADHKAPVILMHMQGTPQTMQKRPRYRDVVDDVTAFFEERLRYAVKQGIPESQILLDPGIGFGKTVQHNVTLLARLNTFQSLGRPLVVGVSRKSFLGKLLGSEKKPLDVDKRLEGSLSAGLWSLMQGASGLRVHDVAETRRALTIWSTLSHEACA